MVACRLRVLLFLSLTCFVAGCTASQREAKAPASQVLFVCEHGNVKSLMAASYFNQMAQQRGLSLRAVSRGSAPDSNTVPPAIAQHLSGEGFDVSGFHPTAVSATDVSASLKVVTIGTALPAQIKTGSYNLQEWNDVPAASVDYEAAHKSLETHVKSLLDEFSPR